ncbi:HesB/YadR/YfhF family protein [Neobacillus mesonae]|uniref:HesB/YadR/YfhF family protein n=1 Tax=Neobacillus mesonae TaxID=1193713 RepID=A0A3Q9QWP5_9BACI|nr:iron-sulfur cluster biosynthesis family protein [Neobacillus mesonae]AZU62024.1 HesB/YadR/YfhF family protein [Neobacillus mesonae]MED4206505.1 iron-sulfur cluster biosynthesis family protein [Neobacillus mesonae]
MKINISEQALRWFKEEVGLSDGGKIKFYSQIYGCSPVQENYSLAFTVDNEPLDMEVSTEIDGITFYVEGSDVWFFNGHDLHVDYNEKKDELEYRYTK